MISNIDFNILQSLKIKLYEKPFEHFFFYKNNLLLHFALSYDWEGH